MLERIYINKEEDRLTVAAILVKNKYTVRQGKLRRSGSRTHDYFLEFSLDQSKEEIDEGKLHD